MTSHRAFFGDADHGFRLGPDQIPELERVTGLGIGELSRRLLRGDFRYDDLRQTIRLALIGGGTVPETAAALITAYVDPRPLNESMLLATEIVSALYFGTPKPQDAPPSDEDDNEPIIDDFTFDNDEGAA